MKKNKTDADILESISIIKNKVDELEKRLKKIEKISPSKELLLDFLQKNQFDLLKTLPNVFDVRFDDNPPRIVLIATESVSVPTMTHKNVEIPFEVQIISKMSEQEQSNLNIKETISPLGTPKNQKAYQAFLKRHKAVKTK